MEYLYSIGLAFVLLLFVVGVLIMREASDLGETRWRIIFLLVLGFLCTTPLIHIIRIYLYKGAI